jgi:hypothetical protein
MSSLTPQPRFRRRNPRWEEDGPSARREHRRRLAREITAFGTSLVAVVMSGAVWAVHLGVTSLVHI